VLLEKSEAGALHALVVVVDDEIVVVDHSHIGHGHPLGEVVADKIGANS
jgi:hypothetical protein